MSIGAGTTVDPSLGLIIALAIAVDNISEGLGVGEIVIDENKGKQKGTTHDVFIWTGTIGAALFVSSVAGWLVFRGLPQSILGFLFAVGGGGMFYLTITDLVPPAEQWHYQQSAAVACAVGFLIIYLLSQLS